MLHYGACSLTKRYPEAMQPIRVAITNLLQQKSDKSGKRCFQLPGNHGGSEVEDDSEGVTEARFKAQ